MFNRSPSYKCRYPRAKNQCVELSMKHSIKTVDRSTEQFIHDQNIHRYRRLLWRVTDGGERLAVLGVACR
jgi:hypothetical protein